MNITIHCFIWIWTVSLKVSFPIDSVPFNEKSILFLLLCTTNFVINQESIYAPLLCHIALIFYSCSLIYCRLIIIFDIWESKSTLFLLFKIVLAFWLYTFAYNFKISLWILTYTVTWDIVWYYMKITDELSENLYLYNIILQTHLFVYSLIFLNKILCFYG